MEELTRPFIFLYKLKKCVKAQITGINSTAIVIIFILLAVAIFQQIYYPREITIKQEEYKRQLEHLQITFGNVTNTYEDLKDKVEEYSKEDWQKNINEIRVLMEALENKISYYESSIFNYFSASRMKKQKWIF